MRRRWLKLGCLALAAALLAGGPHTLRAQDFYWEAPERLSGQAGAYPQALRVGERVVALWQEHQAAGDGGRAWLSLSSYGDDGTKRLERFAGPIAYQGDAPVLFSAAANERGRMAVAVASSSSSVDLYLSMDGGLSFSEPVSVDSGGPFVAPRVFPTASGGWLLFLSRGQLEADVGAGSPVVRAVAIEYAASPDGRSWGPFQPFVDTANPDFQLSYLPAAASVGSRDMVVFQALVSGERASFQLFSRVSDDGGSTWSEPVRVTDFLDPIERDRTSVDDFDNQRPHLAAVDGQLWLSWERRVLSGSPQAYAARLDVSGRVVPGSVERVSQGRGSASEPRIVESAGEPAMVWYDDRTGSSHVYLAFREGVLWRDRDLSLRTRGESSFGRAVYLDGSIWAFWQTGRGAQAAVYGMAPDISVKAPALSAADFSAGQAYNRDRATFRWTVPDDSSGIAGFSYLWSRDPDAEPGRSIMVLDDVTRSAQSADADGPWYFSVRAQDYAGNWSAPARLTFTRDTTPPGAPKPQAPVADADGFLLSNSFSLAWDPPAETDVAGYTWSLEYLGRLDRPPARQRPGGKTAPEAAPPDDYSFGPATDYERSLWERGPAPPPPVLRTRQAESAFQNVDNGYYSFSVAAIDASGNIGPASRVILRAERFVPYTLISDVVQSRDDFGQVSLRLLGRGFAEDGPVTQLAVDADGREPWDLSTDAFSIRSDRLLDGVTLEDLPVGEYRIGLYHPVRGWYFTAPRLSIDVSGTAKFGLFGPDWTPSWIFPAADRTTVDPGILFLIGAILFSAAGMILTLRQVFAVAHESQVVRLEAIALLEGSSMPAIERERAVKAALRKGTGLTAKFAFTISLLMLFVVALVSVPLGVQMMRSQGEVLATGLGERVRVLLESAAQGGRLYLPARNQIELASLPEQVSAMAEARYLTVTGYGRDASINPDIVWASNDPDLAGKIGGGELRPGQSALSDSVSPAVQYMAAAINERANAEVGALSEEIQKLIDEARPLALRLDAASQARLDELSSAQVALQRELTARLAAIAEDSVSSVPRFDPTDISLSPLDYVFYKPILYRQGSEPVYFRGLVRVSVSTDLIVKEIIRSRNILFRNVGLVAAAALGIGIFGSIILAGIIIKPIRKLVRGIEYIRDTPDKKELADFSIEVKSRDEIGTLADTINEMTMGLVIAAREAEFLTVGKEVQKMFIPLETNAAGEKLTTGKDERPTHTYFGYYEGAKGVSGDYFDYRQLDERHWAFIKCDVSGKGVPAALIMVGVATIFTSEFQDWSLRKNGIKLDQLTYRINDFLYRRGFKGRFAAFMMGVYDSRTGDAYICHAGDKFLYTYSAARRAFEQSELVDSPAAGPLDNDMIMLSRAPFTQVKKTIGVGDMMVLFTDGFEESNRKRRNPDFSVVTKKEILRDREGKETEHESEETEELGNERIKEAIEAIMTGRRFTLRKADDPLGHDSTYEFDFSSSKGTPEDLVLGLAAVEKVFRMVPDPTSTEEDMVLVDAKVDQTLERCFVQYAAFCRDKIPHPDPRRSEYLYYRHLKEDEQYDDLTIMVIRRNA